MYINNEERKAKIGKINISVSRDNSIKLRFTYPKGVRRDINVCTNTNEGWVNALRIAQAINADIELGQFDDTLAKYSSRRSQALELASREPNLLEIWERYKELNRARIAKTSQDYLWKDVDRYLANADSKLLELNKAQELLSYLLSTYAVSTVATMFRSALNPATNAAVNAGLIQENPFKKIKIPKPQKKPPEIFTANEVKVIVASFYSNEFNSKYSRYKHSGYAYFVDVLAQTFARPEEIIPLTHDDIKRKGGNTYIKINKRYSKGHLLNSTKTNEIRLFKCNEQLTSLLDSMPKVENEHNLLLPSYSGGYINYHRFRESNWRPIVKALVKQGKVEKYLSPYHLRHTGISLLIRNGYDLKSIATRSGHDVQTLIKHYLATKDDIDLPSLY